MLIACLSVTASAKIKVGVVAAEVMSKKDAANRKEKAEQKAA
jgi:hypothetical protein